MTNTSISTADSVAVQNILLNYPRTAVKRLHDPQAGERVKAADLIWGHHADAVGSADEFNDECFGSSGGAEIDTGIFG